MSQLGRLPVGSLRALAVARVGVSDRRAQNRGCHPARFACGLGDSPDQRVQSLLAEANWVPSGNQDWHHTPEPLLSLV